MSHLLIPHPDHTMSERHLFLTLEFFQASLSGFTGLPNVVHYNVMLYFFQVQTSCYKKKVSHPDFGVH